MDEGALAAAIRDGAASSPTKFGNSWFFAMRISGVGIADRPALEEVCYRNPAIWTSDAMLARCNGLPVIYGHPRAGKLTSDEFAMRTIGTIVLPYISGSGCWGVARICDDGAAAEMARGELSTSPMVTLRPEETVTLDGENRLVIEGDPKTLDHLAVVPRGVWDKGGPLTGIRIDNPQELIMAYADNKNGNKEEKKPDAEVEAGADPIAQMMGALGGIGDAITSLGRRMDAMEQKGEAEERADAVEAIRRNDANVRADGAEARRKAAHDDEAALATEQMRADAVEQSWGRSAPRFMPNETPKAYIVRTLHPHKQHSSAWKDVDLAKLPMEALVVATEQIRADSIVASRTPAAPSGQLIMRKRQSDSGHTIREYFGDVHDADAPFRIQPRLATFRQRDMTGQFM